MNVEGDYRFIARQVTLVVDTNSVGLGKLVRRINIGFLILALLTFGCSTKCKEML